MLHEEGEERSNCPLPCMQLNVTTPPKHTVSGVLFIVEYLVMSLLISATL